ncbi:tetratricopeptide repeat protein, partial [Escherichia coli]|nr:tetratricopeptide repeat protein [Escherichia coli]
MAPQLYEARETAFGRNEFLLIPDVPRQTLSAIYRGEIEETIGLALFAQGKPEDAATRFRRALTVYPKDSAWWRSA